MRYLSITHNSVPPAEFSLNARVHWSARHRVSQQLREDTTALVAEAAWPGGIMQKAQVTITVTFPMNRKRDEDNLRARCKPMIDALVYCGVLLDDNYDVIGKPDIIPLVQKGISQTRIQIQEVE